MLHFNYIIWDVNPEIFSIGMMSLRYYSVLFVGGILLGYLIVSKLYKNENKPHQEAYSLLMYIFAGIILGARLGHCLFYDFGYYSHHLAEIFLPFRMINGRFTLTGFQGLASHGGAIGVLIAVGIYCYRHKWNYLDIMDKIGIVAPLTGGFIRLGNLMNSEIVGKVTDIPFAFIFTHIDNYPRHPAQLYEAIAYFAIFTLLITLYCKKKQKVSPGYYFGLSIFCIFIFRFFIEYIKINQSDFEDGMLFNMGQLLSVPFIVVGIFLFITSKIRNDNG